MLYSVISPLYAKQLIIYKMVNTIGTLFEIVTNVEVDRTLIFIVAYSHYQQGINSI